MIDERPSSSSCVEPQGQRQDCPKHCRRGSRNAVSSPSPSQSPSRVPRPMATGSRIDHACFTPSYVSASSQTSFRKCEVFDVSDAVKHEMRLAFELFDTRKVGKLCYRDLKAAMRALECDVKKAEVQHLMEKYSKDDNNEIRQNEFMQIMIRKYKDKDSELNIGKAFAVFDEEGKGKVTFRNIRKVAKELGQAFTDEQLEAMITKFDMDGDGGVNADEFYNMMRKYGRLVLQMTI